MRVRACKNCGVHRWIKSRGLCNPCYADPEILKKFPSGQPELKESAINKATPLAPSPCPYPAGTEERIQCYADRAANGFAIFHPNDDPTCAGDGAAPDPSRFTTGNRRGYHKCA